tara:strand:+ start:306 stop:566 length:261 start_codon:yes stop_codon:yes gene_type:complete
MNMALLIFKFLARSSIPNIKKIRIIGPKDLLILIGQAIKFLINTTNVKFKSENCLVALIVSGANKKIIIIGRKTINFNNKYFNTSL